MKRAILLIAFLVLFQQFIIAQRVLFQSDFETIQLTLPDSIPAGWKKQDVDQNNPVMGWAVNDTNQKFGGDTSLFKPRSYSGKKSLFIFWLAGNGNNNLNDDWVWTDSLRIETGDSLIFRCLLGSTPLIVPYADSVQVLICSAQTPNSSLLKLETIKSNDSAGIPLNNNTWREFKYNLNQFTGQKIYIAWRYYMVVNQTSGLWINIDDVFIGNRSYIGINPVSSEIPKEFSLSQNYPNPFNPSTKIRFSVPFASNVTIKIYNELGREISTLADRHMKPGIYEANWEASMLPSGVYFFRLTSGYFSQTKKMVLIK